MVQNTCGSQVIVACNPASGSVFAPGTNVVNCEVIDDQRNSARCSFRVIVQPDTTRPNFATPAMLEATCTSPAGATVDFAVEAVDECDASPTVVCTPASGSLFPVGTTTVNCVATDDSGNSSTASFPVKVSGTCDPACVTMQCPGDIEATLRSGSKQAVRFSVTATNLCDRGEVTVDCEPPFGSSFPIGTTVVQCGAKVDGVEKRCSFKVTVRDVTPPWLIVPNDFAMECQGFGLGDGGGATVPFQVKATDNSLQKPNVTCTPASGSWLRLGTNTVTCVASDSSGNKSTNSFAVTVKSGPKCQVEPVVLDLAPDNWGFELGLVGWLPSGAAFEFQPVVGRGIQVHRVQHLKQQLEERIGGDYWQKLQFRIGVEGKQWIGTADNYAIPPGELFDNVGDVNEALLGEMLSKPFTISNRFMTFLIGGTDDMDRLRVELLVATVPEEQPGPIVIGNDRFRVEHKTTGHGRELMRRVAVALDGFGHHVLGRRARIRIVDSSPAGHLNVDDFQFVDVHPLGQRVTIGGKEHPAVVPFDNHYYDWDSPVWGFADLHTHPMSHLGFAEKVMHGTPDGGPVSPANIAAALGDCRCTHGGYGWPNNQCGDFLREAMMLAMDAKGNYTHREGWTSDGDGGVDGTTHEEYARFRHWPVFSTIAHQQMWYEWIKRAYDGGLRVMVALCVNNPLLGSAAKGDGPIDDYTVGNNQIQALKDFVARHDDFMEIALDPFELRDILRRNKLAIIIGSELDDIGNFAMNKSVNEWDPTDDDKDKVRDEIQRLHGLGMRYIFPVHLMDNKFGGTPIVNPMLNMASKFLNGSALEVIPAEPGEHISYWFPEKFDVLVEMKKHELEIGFAAALLPVLAPFLPAVAEVWGGVPLGGAAGGLMPLAMLASVGALGEFGEVIKAVPPDVWPIGNNYPTNSHAKAPWGHKNARGLTPLGRFAVTEMMKRGMMIDVDHMGQRTIDEVFDMAEANSVGYPLNSGHNSFRDQATEHRTENQRTGEQMARIRKLGGLFGVGYENSSQYSVVVQRQHTVSHVDNDCGGTSKTVSQIYLQALEYMDGHNVALGTDINGLIAGPGPRFGPNSSFATKSPWHLEDFIRGQRNGVLYEPMHGRPIVGPAFLGRGVDPGQEFGWGRDEYTVNGNLHYGYTYSKDQRDFFAAIRIFYHFKKQVSDGFPQTLVLIELAKIRSAMSSGYNAGRVHDLAYGLIKGIKGWPLAGGLGGGLIDDTASRELMGRLVFQTEVLDSSVPADLHQFLKLRLSSLRGIWNDYHHIFGGNTPLKRSKTGPKDWDINFDGVAHYGLLPDLFQDMTNVGLEYHDLNPLFHSGDDFARMWTKCLNAADALNRPGLKCYYDLLVGQIEFTWFGEIGDQLEETDDLSGRSGWRIFRGEVSHLRGLNRATVQIDREARQRFYRVKKP